MTLQDTQYLKYLKVLTATSDVQPVSTAQQGYSPALSCIDSDFPYSNSNMNLAEKL